MIGEYASAEYKETEELELAIHYFRQQVDGCGRDHRRAAALMLFPRCPESQPWTIQ